MKTPSEEPRVSESNLNNEAKLEQQLSLQDSEVIEEECSGWFTGIGTDIRNLAVSLKATAGDVVGFVHRSAVSMAAEIAELEREGVAHQCSFSSPLRLPWEVRDNTVYHQDSDLKEKILALSLDETNFLAPFTEAEDESDGERRFVLDEAHIELIRRLLELDANLANMHARLSGRSNVRETLFWQNYFHHCDLSRKAHSDQYCLDDAISRTSSQSSVAAADGRSVQSGDDSSYVQVEGLTTSAPSSLNSFLLVDDKSSSGRL